MGALGETLGGHPNVDFRNERKDRPAEESKCTKHGDDTLYAKRGNTGGGTLDEVWSPSEERLKNVWKKRKKKKP